MFIANILKALGVVVLFFAAFSGYNYGSSLITLDGSFNWDVASLLWLSGAILAAVIYGIAEIINYLQYIHYMLSRSLTPRNQQNNPNEGI